MADVETASEGGSMQQPSHEITPRSRRVGIVSPPPGFGLSTSPPIPVRSPLRPATRSLSNSSTNTSTNTLAPTTTATVRPQGFTRPATPPPLDIDDLAAIVEDAPLPFHRQRRNFITLTGPGLKLAPKPLPSPPDSPISISLDDSHESEDRPPPPPPMSKRQHALLELLSSERAYASDLALIREVHMPLALGRSIS